MLTIIHNNGVKLLSYQSNTTQLESRLVEIMHRNGSVNCVAIHDQFLLALSHTQ